MPRPARIRGAAGAARLAKAQKAISQPVPEANLSAPSSDIYDVSDREKERAAARRQAQQEENDAPAASTTRTRASSSRVASNETTASQRRILDIAHQRRDAAMDRLENMTTTASDQEESLELLDNDDDDDGLPTGAGESSLALPKQRRVNATPLRNRLTDASGLDLDDSMFDDLNTTVDTVALPQHASAHQSAETSTMSGMSGANFRRRPRAGSFLSRDDGPIRPSSRTGPNTPAFSSTLNFGNFKRRAREPSILSTAQKPKSQRPEPELESEDDNDEDDSLGDNSGLGLGQNEFAPEDESTPLRRSKRRSEAADLEQVDSSAKSRKRKSTDGHERRVRSSPSVAGASIRKSIEQPASDDEASETSLPRHQPSTPIMPAMDPELMAPPMSSDSEGDEEMWPCLQDLPKNRGQTPAQRHHDVSDISSPPSLTHSPNYGHSSSSPPARRTRGAKIKKTPAAPKPLPKVTTAQLTEMLPRRRQRKGADADAFAIDEDESDDEVDISGLGADDDELTHLNVQARRHPASRAAANKTNNTNRLNKGKLPVTTTTGSKKRISRTYGRLSDQENQAGDEEDGEVQEEEDQVPLQEEDSQMLTERLGEELKKAVRKFQEVDKWELSYEERTRSSSPVDAR
ncbi:hypothetical protein F5Y16DRAFT_405047 [Xylariaceae sp. FL0255]|nr:hypothetical protein F5Y16DRAFT_405047 [Xylariaceae sp. FL0255]